MRVRNVNMFTEFLGLKTGPISIAHRIHIYGVTISTRKLFGTDTVDMNIVHI